MDVWTVEILDEPGGSVDQVVGPFADESDANEWIEDQWGEFPSDEARAAKRDEQDIDTPRRD